jgi:adenylosuccinate lyase
MDERYIDPEMAETWSKRNKVANWQKVEIAVLKARVSLKELKEEDFQKILVLLLANPIDIQWWLEKEKDLKHDLAAFVEERRRFLPPELQGVFHEKVTSYDIEDTAFNMMLKESIAIVEKYYKLLEKVLVEIAEEYHYTIMNGRTHGQEAGLMTFSKRILGWIQDLRLVDMGKLKREAQMLRYSKLSGIIGNLGTLPPELEKETLTILGFEPYYGATQIMPRELYASIAQVLCQIVLTLDKIATAIRLGARSGRPIFQEPFGKKQKGSSAMPHKKNTISTEQIEGMGRMAIGYLIMISLNIKTWEERAIEQSCVERVAWPDLFHVVVHSLKTMTRVLQGLVVFSDNMLLEIIESRGTYASDEAKELLRKLGAQYGLNTEEAYRIIQLGAFDVFKRSEEIEAIRRNLPTSLEEADVLLETFRTLVEKQEPPISMKDIIAKGELTVSAQLDATEKDVQRWNEILKQIFSDPKNLEQWNQIFLPSNLLRGEKILYEKILPTEEDKKENAI